MKNLRTEPHNYPVIIEKSQDGFYLSTCLMFEDCYSEGKTIAEAMENIKDIIQLRIEEGQEPKKVVETEVYSVSV